jgi:uncharacterized protein YndB with AHSA1/START domain
MLGEEREAMGQIQETLDIRAPIDRVFAALTDPSRASDWNPAVKNAQGAPTGPAHVGTQWNQSAIVAGRPVNLVCRITGLEAPTYGVLEVSGDQRGTITTRCSEIDGGTRVTQTLDYTPPGGIFGQMAGGMIANAIRREMIRTMERQRTIIEEESRAQSGSPAS